MKLEKPIVMAIGNWSKQLTNTRHNAGHLAMQLFAPSDGWHERDRAKVFDSSVATLLVNTTFMNHSGMALEALEPPQLAAVKADPASLLVLHDEVDLPPGTIALRSGGSERGHNGLRSISETLNSRDYARLRIGIGRPPGRKSPNGLVTHVLGEFDAEELDLLERSCNDQGAELIRQWLQQWEDERRGGEHDR